MAGHRELGGMKREGIMSGEEGAEQCMSCRGVCVGMQINERDSKRDARYELRDHRRDHQEHPNWDEWAVCPARSAYQRSQTIGLRLQPMPCSERSSCLLRETSAVDHRGDKEFCWRLHDIA